MAKNNSGANANSGNLMLVAAFFAIAIVLVGGGLLLLGGAFSGIGNGCVGLISIKGEIMVDDSQAGLFGGGAQGSETIASEIEDAGKRQDVKALVILIDSPGGSPVASRHIYDALRAVKKPKVAYFREVAASGGYYVGAGADYIVSEPDAITGSIGVRATITDLSGLFGKIGYNETVFKSGAMKDIGSSSRPMTEEEKTVLQSVISETFTEFKNIVLESRGSRLDRAKFEQVLDARILTGRQALNVGLVDELGNQKDAVRKASVLAGEEKELPVCEIGEKKKTFLSSLLGDALQLPSPVALLPQWKLWY